MYQSAAEYMASLDNCSQQPSSPPLLPTLSQFYEFEAPQLFERDTYSPTQSSIESSPSPQSSCSNTRSSASSTNDKPLRNRSCWVYKHMPDSDIGTKYYSTTNKLEWRCKYCAKRYALNGGTRLIKLHLTTDHNISELSIRQEQSIKRQMSIQDALITGTSNPQKRRCLGGKFITKNWYKITNIYKSRR